MSNLLQFPARFDVCDFSTYTPFDIEDGLAVVLDSQYDPKNQGLLALRSDRELMADFLLYVSLKDTDQMVDSVDE